MRIGIAVGRVLDRDRISDGLPKKRSRVADQLGDVQLWLDHFDIFCISWWCCKGNTIVVLKIKRGRVIQCLTRRSSVAGVGRDISNPGGVEDFKRFNRCVVIVLVQQSAKIKS